MVSETVTLPFNDNLGETIPPDTAHAVSVSLPTWRANVGYEEGEKWVTEKMKCGYPRFFIHPLIEHLAQTIVQQHGSTDQEKALLLPTSACAQRCVDFLLQQNPGTDSSVLRILDFVPAPETTSSQVLDRVRPKVSAVIYPKELWPAAKAFWQHTGEGISSRRAEFCQKALEDGLMIESGKAALHSETRPAKGPRRYQRPISIDQSAPKLNGHTNGDDSSIQAAAVKDSAQFVEERFGRNLNVIFAAQAKLAIRRRIAGSLTAQSDIPDSLSEPSEPSSLPHNRSHNIPNFSVNDVYLFSCGMNAIFTAHRSLLLTQAPTNPQKSIMYGFPYVDTLKILQKFGPGAHFYGHSSASDLDDLETRLHNGERFLSLFCEFPGNPLLKSPDLKRIRALADKYHFAIVIDETIGNFLNVHVLPYADIVVSSLTKIFSGDSNVMGGSLILNPQSRYYDSLREIMKAEYEDNQFEEDSVYLERNSRDFVSRIQRVNQNAEVVAEVLKRHPAVKQVNYPKFGHTREFYDACRWPNGGYGGLLSATFHRVEDAQVFYDHLNTQKGPSLGTNFTLSSPFVLLAHYGELDWAAQYGCELSLVRFSVGLEETGSLKKAFEQALAAIQGHETTTDGTTA